MVAKFLTVTLVLVVVPVVAVILVPVVNLVAVEVVPKVALVLAVARILGILPVPEGNVIAEITSRRYDYKK